MSEHQSVRALESKQGLSGLGRPATLAGRQMFVQHRVQMFFDQSSKINFSYKVWFEAEPVSYIGY